MTVLATTTLVAVERCCVDKKMLLNCGGIYPRLYCTCGRGFFGETATPDVS